jgi:LysM repeat protein
MVALVLGAGCTTWRKAVVEPPAESPAARSAQLLVTTNAEPGAVYETIIYVVQRGDSLSRIARDFNITVTQLRILNAGTLEPGRLRIGQALRVGERRIR